MKRVEVIVLAILSISFVGALSIEAVHTDVYNAIHENALVIYRQSLINNYSSDRSNENTMIEDTGGCHMKSTFRIVAATLLLGILTGCHTPSRDQIAESAKTMIAETETSSSVYDILFV